MVCVYLFLHRRNMQDLTITHCAVHECSILLFFAIVPSDGRRRVHDYPFEYVQTLHLFVHGVSVTHCWPQRRTFLHTVAIKFVRANGTHICLPAIISYSISIYKQTCGFTLLAHIAATLVNIPCRATFCHYSLQRTVYISNACISYATTRLGAHVCVCVLCLFVCMCCMYCTLCEPEKPRSPYAVASSRTEQHVYGENFIRKLNNYINENIAYFLCLGKSHSLVYSSRYVCAVRIFCAGIFWIVEPLTKDHGSAHDSWSVSEVYPADIEHSTHGTE